MTTHLRHHHVPSFTLQSGRVLRDLVQAYTLLGSLNEERDNLVVIFHSLTGTADPRDAWPTLIGPGRVIDTDRFAVLSTNLLGSCYGTSPPPADARVTPRDMAALVRRLVADLDVASVALATGGSLGGMVALEWAASFPRLTRGVVVFAAPASHTAQAIGFNHLQRRAVQVGGEAGLELARMAAMLTYRTPVELDGRFGRERRGDGAFQVQSYLTHHGAKLARRFDSASYVTLLDAMDAHDLGAGRGGSAAALGPLSDRLTGVGIPGDLLYSPEDVRAWTDAAGARYREIRSVHGHDAFLLEPQQVGTILDEALAAAATLTGAGGAS